MVMLDESAVMIWMLALGTGRYFSLYLPLGHRQDQVCGCSHCLLGGLGSYSNE